MRREHAGDLCEPLVAPREIDVERLELVPIGLGDRIRRIGDDQIDRAIGELAEQLEDVGVPELAAGCVRGAAGVRGRRERQRRPRAAQVVRDRELADNAGRALGHARRG